MTSKQRRKRSGSVALSLIVCAGCIPTTARFIQTDASLAPRRRGVTPRVVWDVTELTSPPMSSIGIVQVTGVTTSTLVDFLDVAVQGGRDVGCDALLPHAVYELRSSSAQPRTLDEYLRFGNTGRLHNGVARWQFLCAVQDSSRDPIATKKMAVDAALAIQIKEATIMMCRFEQPTGSHVLKEVCRFDR